MANRRRTAQGARQARRNRLAELEVEAARLEKEKEEAQKKLNEYVKMAAGLKRITINSIRDLQNLEVLLDQRRDWRGRVYIGRGISEPSEKISVTTKLRNLINAHNSTDLGVLVQLNE